MSILQAAQAELRKHQWDTFVENAPSIAHGGKGTVTPGCPHCSKSLYTINQFVEHLANDVLPGILERALSTPAKFDLYVLRQQAR